MTPKHVIFGTGPLGMSVMRALQTRHAGSIRMVNRSGHATVPTGVDVVAADAYQVSDVQRVTHGADVVYQCAQPGYTEWQAKFPPLQAAIVEGVAANGAKLIVGENLYMYGDTDGAPLTEDLPYNAHTRKGKVRAEMSKALLSAHQSGKLRVAMARGADFYGEGVLGSALGERTFPGIVQGKRAEGLGNIDLPHTYTVIDDFGTAMAILGEHEAALGQAWHVPNPPTLTTRQLIQQAIDLAGTQAKIVSMGKMMLRIGGLFIPEAREGIEMMYEFDKPFIVDHSKFERAFGDIATPHAVALQKTLAWYRAR